VLFARVAVIVAIVAVRLVCQSLDID